MRALIRLLPLLCFIAFAIIGMLFLDGRLTLRPSNCWEPVPVNETGHLPQCESHHGHEALHRLISLR